MDQTSAASAELSETAASRAPSAMEGRTGSVQRAGSVRDVFVLVDGVEINPAGPSNGIQSI